MKLNAIQHLLNQHVEIVKLFHKYVETGEQAHKQKQSIAEELIDAITKHAELEEEVLFSAFKEKGGEEAEEMVLEGVEEHEVAEFIMERLRSASPEDKAFDAIFKVLMENIKLHFLEEEREIFPKAQKVLKGDLDRLGEEMEALEKELTE